MSGMREREKYMPMRIIMTLVAVIVLFGTAAIFFSIREKDGLWKGSEGKIRIAATFYPLGFLAKEIGGDLVFVRTIVPFGIEPHDFDPPLRDIADIRKAQLFLVNGAGLDPWAERAAPELSSDRVSVMIASEKVPLLTIDGGAGTSGHFFGETSPDPHFFLDPKRFEMIGAAVLDELLAIDPANAVSYRKNFSAFQKKIRSIDRGYTDIGAGICKKKTIIVSHNAFSYLSDRGNFSILSLTGTSPESEVSTKHITDIVDRARTEGIRFVLLESLSSPAAVESVAREIGAEVLPMNPIEGLTNEEVKEGKDYFSLQAENLVSLRKALECE